MSRRAVFFLVVSVLLGLILIYPPLRLYQWADFDPTYQFVVGLSFVFPIAIRLIHERTNTALSRALTAIAMTWMGVCFIAFCLVFIGEWVTLLNIAPATQLATLISALVVTFSLYGFVNARRLHTYTLDINALEAVQGLRLAQISDVHIGSRHPNFLRPIVAHTNALKPDFVVITGDLVDMHNITTAALSPLAELDAQTIFCIGNHERYVDVDAICARLEELGVIVLRNQCYVPPDRTQIEFIGIDDAEDRQQVQQQLPQLVQDHSAYRVLLYHRPDGAQAAAEHGINLMLTGHTHRGQIVPFNFLVKRVFPQYYRHYAVDNLNLYVSPGTGTWGPILRLGSKCEITLIRLL